MLAAPRSELAADLELRAVCTTAPSIAAAIVLAGVLLSSSTPATAAPDIGRAAA